MTELPWLDPSTPPGPPAKIALPSIAYGSSNPTGLDSAAPSAPPALVPLTQPTIPQAGAPTNLFAPPAPPQGSPPITFTLAPGQQMSFYYGSTVGNVNLMASSEPGMYPNTVAYAPYRTITMTHAVQQPYWPNEGVTIAPRFVARSPGDTSVVFNGNFSVDGLTANAVVLTTSWGDFVDTELTNGVEAATDGTNRRYVGKSGRLAEWTLGTSDTGCSFAGNEAATNSAGTPAGTTVWNSPALVQQYGDTKTREIFFQATATSRFREFFPASLQSDGANFQSSTPQMAPTAWECLNTGTGVRIPATAPPHAPKILYVVPTYQWGTVNSQNKTVNTRTGRGLRVFVDRPWFTTGDTEMLGVVVMNLNTPPGTSPAALAPFVSQWGLDPIRFPQADTLPSLDASQLLGGATFTDVPLLENGQTVTVVAYAPEAFDPVRNLWYFDIQFAPSAVEAPFVRLALMRFQPNALGPPPFPSATDLRMSNVVLSDMVKLTPDRTATYKTASGAVTVTVEGQVYASATWPPTISAGTLSANTVATAASYGRAVYAQLQESTPNVTTPGEFDWTTIAGPFQLEPYQTQGSAGTSTSISYISAAPIAKPSSRPAGTQHQILVTEHEVFLTDAAAAFPSPTAVSPVPSGLENGFTPAGSQVEGYPADIALSGTPSGDGTTSRIVFSDVFPLPY